MQLHRGEDVRGWAPIAAPIASSPNRLGLYIAQFVGISDSLHVFTLVLWVSVCVYYTDFFSMCWQTVCTEMRRSFGDSSGTSDYRMYLLLCYRCSGSSRLYKLAPVPGDSRERRFTEIRARNVATRALRCYIALKISMSVPQAPGLNLSIGSQLVWMMPFLMTREYKGYQFPF